jgi:hypothetical protein
MPTKDNYRIVARSIKRDLDSEKLAFKTNSALGLHLS